MASIPATSLYQGKGLKCGVSAYNHGSGKPCFGHLQSPLLGSFPSGKLHIQFGFNGFRKARLLPCAKSEKRDEDIGPEYDELPPYTVYFDSTSGRLEPAYGDRASIPREELWSEGTSDRVRAARAPPPTGVSAGSPSFGQNPGSRRKKNMQSVATSESSEASIESDYLEQLENVEEAAEDPKDVSSDYVIYQTESEETLTDWELDKELGRPHPFVDPAKRRTIENTLTQDDLWWTWRKPEKGSWSWFQKRKPDVETVFLKAMADAGQVKIHGDEPTVAEVALYKSRKNIFKEERLQAEQDRLHKIGPIAYYSEWVKAWDRDTSPEAIQKHFEETGENESIQMIEMFSNQTAAEYRIMMGNDPRIRRDPMAMRMPEDQIKRIWGGDPVYPTINYIQDPNAIVDYRAADIHEPTPNMLDYLKEEGKIRTREELNQILARENPRNVETMDMDKAMAQAVDIGENDDDGEDSEEDGEEMVEDKGDADKEEEDEDGDGDEDEDEDDNDDGGGSSGDDDEEEEEETITRNWSIYKTTVQPRKSKKSKPKKNGPMTLKEAIDDSENLTDFLMDFDNDDDE